MAEYDLPYSGDQTAEYLAKARDFSGVPLGDGLYAGTKTYTTYDQYLNDTGALFKLNPSVPLGYTINVITYPDAKDDPNLIPYTSFESASTEAIEQFEEDGAEAIRSAGGVPLGDGVWGAGKTYTAFDQVLYYNDIPYKPLNIPYTTQGINPTITPDSENVRPYSDVNSGNIGNYLFPLEQDIAQNTAKADEAINTAAAVEDRVDVIEPQVASNTNRITQSESDISTLQAGQGGGVIGYDTQANLFADLAHNEGTVGQVLNDPTPENNASYRKVGASGAGSWEIESGGMASLAYQNTLDNAVKIGDEFNSCNKQLGNWDLFSGSSAGSSVFVADHVEVTTAASTYPGVKMNKPLKSSTVYFAEFEAKIESGNIHDWALTNSAIAVSSELITGLTNEYQKYVIQVSETVPGNELFLLYQTSNEVGNTISIRNFWYAEENSVRGQELKLKISESYIDAVLDEESSMNFSQGGWVHTPNGGGTTVFVDDHIEVTTTGSSYSGTKKTGDLVVGGEYYVDFEAKLVSGSPQAWFLTNSNIGTQDESFSGLTNEYQRFSIKIEPPTSANRRFTFYQAVAQAGNTIAIRNFWYYERNSWFKSINRELSSLKDSAGTDLLKADATTGSIADTQVSNEISDLLRPDRKGKLEFLTEDKVPSVNTMGDGYLFDNGGTIELRVVKNATELVGVALASKGNNVVTPQSFSIVYVGDSITNGVGASPNYRERTTTKLQADGHTVTKSTNKGYNGFDALQLSDAIAGSTPDAHDYAVLMIGMNDIAHWIEDTGYPGVIGNIKPTEFREWFKTNLYSLISNIHAYCGYSKLFLVAPTPQRIEEPNLPTAERVAGDPLFQVVIQEMIDYYKLNSDTVHLCRGDYYLKNPTATEIPDRIHPSNDGAEKLAQGVRDEVTFRV